MTDAAMLERIAARRAELDLAEQELMKQLADVRVERDELVVAERWVQRISETGSGYTCRSRWRRRSGKRRWAGVRYR